MLARLARLLPRFMRRLMPFFPALAVQIAQNQMVTVNTCLLRICLAYGLLRAGWGIPPTEVGSWRNSAALRLRRCDARQERHFRGRGRDQSIIFFVTCQPSAV